MDLLGSFNYFIYVALMMVGFYAVLAKPHLIKKVLGLGLFQTGIFIFYISLAVIDENGVIGTAPVWQGADTVYSNPLPHVLILTAIVVSVSTMAVALALVVNIHREFGTIEADELDLGRSRKGDKKPDLPDSSVPFAEAKKKALEAFERAYLLRALRENDGNISRTAEAIGMVRQSLQQKIRELGLRSEEW